MQPIDRKTFFDIYCDDFGPLTQRQVDGIEQLLGFLEADTRVTDLRWAAYMLATVKRECGGEWHPIKEYSRGKGQPYGKMDPSTGQIYYGRGYVQLTWKDNYRAMGKIFGVDLVANPDLALEPQLAYNIMSYGMRLGAFTGVGLRKYINDEKCDYVNARRIINGTDRAELIAGYAKNLERALREGVA